MVKGNFFMCPNCGEFIDKTDVLNNEVHWGYKCVRCDCWMPMNGEKTMRTVAGNSLCPSCYDGYEQMVKAYVNDEDANAVLKAILSDEYESKEE